MKEVVNLGINMTQKALYLDFIAPFLIPWLEFQHVTLKVPKRNSAQPGIIALHVG